jgi:hypothetical protein
MHGLEISFNKRYNTKGERKLPPKLIKSPYSHSPDFIEAKTLFMSVATHFSSIWPNLLSIQNENPGLIPA